jgi:hypothetical protein
MIRRARLTAPVCPLPAQRGEGKGEGPAVLWRALLLAAIAAGCSSPRDASVERRAAPLVWGGERKLLANDAAELDQFGWSVALASDRALVGAIGESGGRGAAYTFVTNGDGWFEEQKLVASDGVELDKFGSSVALGTDRVIVGAYGASSFRGAAYVFVKNGSSWTEEQKLVASDGAAGENFGWSVSLAGDRALIGAHGSSAARGAAYVFARSGGAWTEEQKLVASDGAADDDLGWSVSLAGAGDRALLGAPGSDGTRGAAYVVGRSGGAWTEEQKLVANDGVAFDNFGNAVALAGDRALVGAFWADEFRGAVYAFVNSGDAWTAEQKLVASDGAAGRFGNSLSLTTDRALIGAFAREDGRGAAYLFSRSDGNSWAEEESLVPSDGQADLFAWSVSLAADRALVGAIYNDQLRGAVYLYSRGGEDRDAGSADAGDSDGGPIEAGPPGPGTCARADDCTSGHCEDAICCDRTCSPSERCRADLKVSGEDGVCGPARAAALGALCKFDVQCTSGHCSGTDGVCTEAPGAPDAACTSDDACVDASGGNPPGDGDGDGCGCGTASSPAHGPHAWCGVALVSLLLRRPRRVRHHP